MSSTDFEGITPRTALEIHNNPKDLRFFVFRNDENDAYFFTVNRGPRDYFETLITVKSSSETVDDLVRDVEEFLHGIPHMVSAMKFPKPIETMGSGLIEVIARDLRQSWESITYMH